MSYTVNYIKAYSENEYSKIIDMWSFVIGLLLEEIQDKEIKEKIIDNKDNLLELLEKKDFLIGNYKLFIYQNKDNKNNLFIEYVESQEYYNWNEETNYIWLMSIKNEQLQKIIKNISKEIENNKWADNTLIKGVKELFQFFFYNNSIIYINDTIFWDMDINGYIGQWKSNNAKYNKEKNLSNVIDLFIHNLIEKNIININEKKEYIMFLIVNIIEGIWNKDDYKYKKINDNIHLLDNLLESDWSENLVEIIKEIRNKWYIDWLICERCSAKNGYNINYNTNQLNFVCIWCWEENIRKI